MSTSPRESHRHGRAPRALASRAVLGAVALLSLAASAAVHAGPTGGQVVAGSGSIQQPDAATTLVQQQSRSLAIDWTGFDVALEGNQTADALFWMRACDAFLPALASLVAIGFVWLYPITEQTAADLRKELEARRSEAA